MREVTSRFGEKGGELATHISGESNNRRPKNS